MISSNDIAKTLNIVIPGDAVDLNGISTIADPKERTIVFLSDKKFVKQISTHSSKLYSTCTLLKGTNVSLAEEHYGLFSKVIEIEVMELAISKVSKLFYDAINEKRQHLVDGRQTGEVEIHPTAEIAQNVFIGERVHIEANVKILPGSVIMSDVSIAEGSVIFPNVTIYPDVIIGKNCIIHAGVVIGGDGFGYNFYQGSHHKVWHTGSVSIGDEVEIGANSTVDRATFGVTSIGAGSKIDNLVMIAHNSNLGMGVIFCGQSGTAGSATVGNFSVAGGKAGIGPGSSIGDGCQVAGNAQVNSDWPDGSVIAGHPARPLNEWMRGLAFVRRESLKKR